MSGAKAPKFDTYETEKRSEYEAGTARVVPPSYIRKSEK